MNGSEGTEASTVTATVLEGIEVFPAASVANALKIYTPSRYGLARVNEKALSHEAVASPRNIPFAETVTFDILSAVPITSIMALFMRVPSAGKVMTGGKGGVTSHASPSPKPSTFSCPGF